MATIDLLLLIGSILIVISILFAKLFHNIGIPTLLLFIVVGMLAGSEGIGGIYFDDAILSRSIGIIALVFILFSGGLDTKWSESRSSFKPAFTLATLGVLLTAIIVGLFVMLIFKTSFLWGFLVGSIISSTDAAAVFSILRTGNIGLKGRVKPLLELESGSNDPMAIFLTIGTIELLLQPDSSILHLLLIFFLQLGIGSALGFIGGKIMIYLINRLNFFYEGIYPVFALALSVLIYSFATFLEGSGFLAVYMAGIILGNGHFIHKKSLLRFFDSLAVLSQIAMFVTLGLLVFPSDLITIIGIGILFSAILMLLARPFSVFVTLIPFKFNLREKLFISWVGLRGAVPIILASFPLAEGVANSRLIFNVVFFIVLTSTLLQGWSINFVSKLLNLARPAAKKIIVPIEFTSDNDSETELVEIFIPHHSSVRGKQIVDLNFPDDTRIVLVVRDDKNIIPVGNTVLEEGDLLLLLANKKNKESVNEIFNR